MSQVELEAKANAFEEMIEFAEGQIKVIRGSPDSQPSNPRSDKIEWHDVKWGAWAFATDQQGAPIPEAASLVSEIKSSGGKVERDGFVFMLSRNGKFCQRKKSK